MRGKPRSFDDYLATVSEPKRAALNALRGRIHAVIPNAIEVISYGIPAFRIEGGIVAGFGATSKGCSYFPFSGSTLTTLASELGAYSQS